MFGLDVLSHWIILGVLAIAFFGYKKLPHMTRSVGRSLRIFKSEIRAMTHDSANSGSTSSAATTTPLVAGAATTEPSVTR
jgi:sec-independent protein translocase protein TatA